MPTTKNGTCNDCCCSTCGVKLGADAAGCCLCVCDALCVIVDSTGGENEDPCDKGCVEGSGVTPGCACIKKRDRLLWDDVLCQWSGTVVCGLSSIDLAVKIKKCDGVCYACVTSSCLSMTGDCGTTDCFALGTCGSYTKKCGQAGGLSISFTKDISGCGDTNCSDATFTIECEDTINPQPSPAICKNCDCVCDCISITYTEDDTCGVTKTVCWNPSGSQWSALFSNNNCSWADQSVTISLVDDGTGCCQFELATSRGTVDAPAAQDAGCPRPSLTWTGTDGAATFTVEMECTLCGEVAGIANQCCDDLPDTLVANVCESNCAPFCVDLHMNGRTATEITWRGTGTGQCSDGADPDPPSTCEDFDVDIELACVALEAGGWGWFVRIYCGDDLLAEHQFPIDGLEGSPCNPFCILDPLFGIEDFQTANCNVGSGCVGTAVVIDILEKCRP